MGILGTLVPHRAASPAGRAPSVEPPRQKSPRSARISTTAGNLQNQVQDSARGPRTPRSDNVDPALTSSSSSSATFYSNILSKNINSTRAAAPFVTDAGALLRTTLTGNQDSSPEHEQQPLSARLGRGVATPRSARDPLLGYEAFRRQSMVWQHIPYTLRQEQQGETTTSISNNKKNSATINTKVEVGSREQDVNKAPAAVDVVAAQDVAGRTSSTAPVASPGPASDK
ncbi:unnamed protein product [Amoebophrya sp. A25]|nr:unnamed protein product [Amoebophrya sp. A25]|eukprot:GSA25T00010578001.1